MQPQVLSLTSLIVVPACAAFLCFVVGAITKSSILGQRIASVIAIVAGVLTLTITLSFLTNTTGDPNAALSIQQSVPWIPSFGVTYSLAFDGISGAFALLTAVVSLVVILWSGKPANAGASWYALLLLGESSVMGAFLATDLVLFYVFYELMLLPVLGGIALWGGPRRLNAALKFLLYTMTGSVLMFLAILYFGWEARALFDDSGNGFAFEVGNLAAQNMLTFEEEVVLGLAFLIAFAIKVPMVPLHAWAPDTYREAPHGIAAFTAALLGKVGLYGIIRFVWPLFPSFMVEAGPYLAAVGALSVVYGALVAMAQRDIRSLLAYSSVSHLGFCVLGLASTAYTAWTGSVFLAVSHGLVTAGLFLVFGKIIDREGTREFDELGGLATQVPVIAFFLMVLSIAAVALPLTSSFVGEFLIIVGSWQSYPEWTAVAALGVVFGAVYTLTAYLRSMFGESRREVRSGGDIRGLDAVVLSVLAALIITLGLFPARVLSMVTGAFPTTLMVSHDGYSVGDGESDGEGDDVDLAAQRPDEVMDGELDVVRIGDFR